MRKMVLTCGIPGCGKSTLVKKLTSELDPKDFVVCSNDNYFVTKDGRYLWSAVYHDYARQYCQGLAAKAAFDGVPLIIIDNTNLTPKAIRPLILIAKDFGYTVNIVEPDTSWKYDVMECYKRNTHNVPLATIQQMYNALMFSKKNDLLTNLLQET